MNKIISPYIIRCLALILISYGAYSQKASTDSSLYRSEPLYASVSLKKPDNPDSHPKIWNSISTRALREFKRSFKNVDNEKWHETHQLYIAIFFSDNIRNRVVYGKKGNWLYTIRYYTEKELPRNIRAIVKGTYYDYHIRNIEEVDKEGNIIYIVHLEDDKSWMNVSVCNDEMEVMEKLLKPS